jgi:uncharacterized protein (DUF2147 family)
MKFRAAAFFAVLLASAAAATAAAPKRHVAKPSAPEVPVAEGPVGFWRVADGSAVIEIKPCSLDLCGFVAAAPPPGPGEKPAIGQQILLGMRSDGVVWRGPIFNLDDGNQYDGEISLEDADHLKIKGCLLGGGLCGGETWKRESAPASR